MARKSTIEEWIEVAALLPWYVALVIAVISYVAFHHFSLQPVPTSPHEMGRIVLIGASHAFQFLVPLIFICGALHSYLHARRKRNIFDRQTSLQSIRELSWQEFEWLVSEAYSRKGYRVVERGGRGPDGGVDLVLHKDGRKTIVQCKHWSAMKVIVSLVREAYGVMVAEGADECVFVASGIYTRDAKLFANGKPIQLIDGKGLLELIQGIKIPNTLPTASVREAAAPTCPDCGSSMVSRIAKRGHNAGSKFWGCPRYPTCLGKRSV
jgi:restriction system protein